MNSLPVQRVPFGEAQLVVFSHESGEKFLSIAEPCRQLGLSYEAQASWVRRRWPQGDWRDEGAAGRFTLFLAKRRVAVWLNRIPEEDCPDPGHRRRLRYYQDHCDEVLTRHFEGDAAPAVGTNILDVALALHRSAGVALTAIKETQARVTALESRADAADARALDATLRLANSPEEEKPRELTVRTMIGRRVRDYAAGRNVEEKDAWVLIYRELRDRYGFDARARARLPGGKAIDHVERHGYLDRLWLIARHLLV